MSGGEVYVPTEFRNDVELCKWYLRATCAKYFAESMRGWRSGGNDDTFYGSVYGFAEEACRTVVECHGDVGEIVGENGVAGSGGRGDGGVGVVTSNGKVLFGENCSVDIAAKRVEFSERNGQKKRLWVFGESSVPISNDIARGSRNGEFSHKEFDGTSGVGFETVSREAGCVTGGQEESKTGQRDGVVRGKHYAKNRKRRERAKAEEKRSEVKPEERYGYGRPGPNHARNVEKRRLQRERRDAERAGCFYGVGAEERAELGRSFAAKLRAENELREIQARQRIELEKAKDMDELKRRQQTTILRQTETNKVQVEKAFASLARSGNVPGVVGTVETVVSDGSAQKFSGVGSGTISPNSSISLAEIRAIQKESLDKTQEIEKLKRRLNRLLEAMPYLKGQAFADPEAPETVDTGVTVDTNGFPIGEFGDGYDGGIREDGKWHFGQDIY